MAEHARTHRVLAVVAGLLGAVAVAARDPYPDPGRRPAGHDVQYVGALDLARWIRDGRPRVRLLDIRPDSQFAAYHIPGAEHVAASGLSPRRWLPGDTVVLYAEDDADAERSSLVVRAGGAEPRVLRGGLLAWIAQIAEPRLPALPPTATPVERAARRDHLELSRYFGGMPVVGPPSTGTPVPAAGRSPQSEAATVARILRRGC